MSDPGPPASPELPPPVQVPTPMGSAFAFVLGAVVGFVLGVVLAFFLAVALTGLLERVRPAGLARAIAVLVPLGLGAAALASLPRLGGRDVIRGGIVGLTASMLIASFCNGGLFWS